MQSFVVGTHEIHAMSRIDLSDHYIACFPFVATPPSATVYLVMCLLYLTTYLPTHTARTQANETK